ncbi:hypothetical protein [Mesorhizobium sp. WSM4884]|uniref:hypothetical protein n=1 Tax=Mesorhizobium sp. WSM4884 TaxID=3038542 RepID=UPI0024166ABC|nr:hypothetical protein [Mesorhizobium sp. WSM4884]MDG4884297.1 hypothetical protein [Mesorhizobium sp. WSM4884]
MEVGGFVARNAGKQTAAGDVKDFTEAARRTFQFAGNLQLASAVSGRRPTSICYMRLLSGQATRSEHATRAEESRGLHDKFTAPCKACRPGLLFIALFDKCAGKRLFPVPFVAEW